MTSKKIFITILAAIVITFGYINLLGLAANNFIVEGGKIVFDFRTLDVKFHFIFFYMLTLIPWKVVLWDRDWFDVFINAGVYFPFFMMFIMGWFTLDIPTNNFIATLSFFTAFVVGWVFSFVLMCTLGDVFAIAFSKKPEEKAKNTNDDALLYGFAAAAYMIANKLEKEEGIEHD